MGGSLSIVLVITGARDNGGINCYFSAADAFSSSMVI